MAGISTIHKKANSIKIWRIVKPLVVFIATSLFLFLSQSFEILSSDSTLLTSAFAGIFQVYIVLSVGHHFNHFTRSHAKWLWLDLLFAPKPRSSLSLLISGIATFLWVLAGNIGWHHDSFVLTQMIMTYLWGASAGFVLYQLIGFKSNKTRMDYHINSDRYDVFVAALISVMVLGGSMAYFEESGNVGFVIVPLSFALFSLLLTYAGALVSQYYSKQHKALKRFTISMGSALILVLIAEYFTGAYLPDVWVNDNKEFQAYSVFLAMELGIIGGLIAGNATQLHKAISGWYLNYLLKTKARFYALNVSLRVFINLILVSLPVLIIIGAIGLAFVEIGLYGLSIVFLCMTSNVGVNLIVEEDRLSSRNLRLTDAQKQKIRMLAPTISQTILRMFSKA